MADEQRPASLSPSNRGEEALKEESMEVAAASSSSTVTNFRWPDYPRSMASTLRSLKEEEDFVDVTLACNSRQFTAHKVVLSACSPYFRQLLKVCLSIFVIKKKQMETQTAFFALRRPTS